MSYDLAQFAGHSDQAVSRFLEVFKSKPVIEALARSYCDQVQELEDATWEVLLERLLANAVGVQLDVLGKIVGQPRVYVDDNDYRTVIRARIAINNSEATSEDLINIARLILLNGEAFEIRDEPPAQVRITVLDAITVTPSVTHALLTLADAAGVRLLLEYHVNDPFTGLASVIG